MWITMPSASTNNAKNILIVFKFLLYIYIYILKISHTNCKTCYNTRLRYRKVRANTVRLHYHISSEYDNVRTTKFLFNSHIDKGMAKIPRIQTSVICVSPDVCTKWRSYFVSQSRYEWIVLLQRAFGVHTLIGLLVTCSFAIVYMLAHCW